MIGWHAGKNNQSLNESDYCFHLYSYYIVMQDTAGEGCVLVV